MYISTTVAVISIVIILLVFFTHGSRIKALENKIEDLEATIDEYESNSLSQGDRLNEIESWERRISNLEIIVTSEDSELPTPSEDYAQRIENLKIPKVLQQKD